MNLDYNLSIDTLANISFCHNKDMLEGIHVVNYTVKGATGQGSCNSMGYLKGIRCKAAYLPEAGANALSARDAQSFKCTIMPGHSWRVHISDEYQLKFRWNEANGSYTLRYDNEISDEVTRTLDQQYGREFRR